MFGLENIFLLQSYFPELILSRNFNKTLENINKEILTELLINKIYEQIQDKVNSLFEDFNITLYQKQSEIKEELDNVLTAELYENMQIFQNQFYQILNHY